MSQKMSIRREDHVDHVDSKTCSGCSPFIPISITAFRLKAQRGKWVRASMCKKCESKKASKRQKRKRADVRRGLTSPTKNIKPDTFLPKTDKVRREVFERANPPDFKQIPTLFWWPGSQQRFVNQLARYLPWMYIDVTIDLFCGPGTLSFRKPRSEYEIVNDIDGGLINFFEVLANKKTREALIEKLDYTPYARPVYERAKDDLSIYVEDRYVYIRMEDPVDWAWHWAVCLYQARNQYFGASFGYTKYPSGDFHTYKRWANLPRDLQTVGEILEHRLIENLPWQTLLDKYLTDDQETLLIVDPGDLADKRRPDYYTYISRDDYEQLIYRLIEITKQMPNVSIMFTTQFAEEMHTALTRSGWKNYRVGQKKNAVDVIINPQAFEQLKREDRIPE